MAAIDEIIENFSVLDDWDDRYRYVIELGRMLTPLPEAARNETNKVQGCASQVWLDTRVGANGAAGESHSGRSRGLAEHTDRLRHRAGVPRPGAPGRGKALVFATLADCTSPPHPPISWS